MINNYEIKIENNEAILYLHFDFNNEIGLFNLKDKKDDIQNVIKKYIKENKINFKGIKIAIVVGGVLMGTLILNKPVDDIEYYNPSIMDVIVNKTTIEIENNDEAILDIGKPKEEIKEEIEKPKEEIKIEVPKEETKVEKPKDETKVENKQEINKESKEDKIEISKEEIEKTKEEVKEEEKQEIKEENLTYVTIYRNNGTVITLELEEYIIGVVAAEMPASFSTEALKAQAVIARTYALKSIKNNRVLTDDSKTQNYKDNEQLKKMWGNSYNTYYNKIKNAVENTKGIYLTYNGNIIEAVYHSTSNGYTESSINVWENDYSYLISVESPYDSINTSFLKETFITYEKISKLLNITVTKETEFNILSYTSSNRVDIIEVDGKDYKGTNFRNLLGLRSTDFEIKKEENGINFITKGYGHGVGMSQYGANGMAKNGYTYKQILRHYYNGITISNM